jgi:uncharacterized protein
MLNMQKNISVATLLLGSGIVLSGIYFLTTADETPKATESSAHSIQFTNRLALEKSPYLLQHAHNPVEWYPWGQEAFDKAKAEDKLIFLSVGYSTCHWCHVMERESFENVEIAKIMNEHFVCVKVDREERPDVDKVYMSFVQATTGGGGWPMNCWLTPDLKPVVGATYFPPVDKFGRPGFPTVLNQIATAWKMDRASLIERGDEILKALQDHFTPTEINESALGPQSLDTAYHAIAKNYDETLGGFGSSPKFPRPVTLNFLQRYAVQKTAKEEHREKAKAMALFTLERMAAGGMYDHLGGGFHRYSVDQFWHVPHFEKMLYDQAQLTVAYLEAFQVTGDTKFESVARDIMSYILRDMTDEKGGFYSAEDADSFFEHGKPEHGEGVFYVWSQKEITDLLGDDAAARFNAFYGVEKSGNAPAGSDPHEEFTGKNILIQRLSLEEAATKFKLSTEALAAELKASRETLFKVREKRPRPHLDDKVITAWNGLMISAFSKAHQVLNEASYLSAATSAADFIKEHLYSAETKRLVRNYRDGASDIEGFVDDYAFLIQGLLDLYEASFDVQWLEWAQTLQATQDKLFYDGSSAGYYSATGNDPSILLRLKEDYDGAEPSPNSVSIMNLLRLAQITANDQFDQQARKTLAHFSESLTTQPSSAPQMLAALNFSLVKAKQIVFAAKPESKDFGTLLRSLHKSFIPNKVVLLADGGAGQAFLGKQLAFIRTVAPINNRATAFVCEDFVCQLPTAELAQFEKLIRPE